VPELAPKPRQLIIFGEKKKLSKSKIRVNLYPLNSNKNDIAFQVKVFKLRGLKTAQPLESEVWRKETGVAGTLCTDAKSKDFSYKDFLTVFF
jgi:hypothetical protein